MTNVKNLAESLKLHYKDNFDASTIVLFGITHRHDFEEIADAVGSDPADVVVDIMELCKDEIPDEELQCLNYGFGIADEVLVPPSTYAAYQKYDIEEGCEFCTLRVKDFTLVRFLVNYLKDFGYKVTCHSDDTLTLTRKTLDETEASLKEKCDKYVRGIHSDNPFERYAAEKLLDFEWATSEITFKLTESAEYGIRVYVKKTDGKGSQICDKSFSFDNLVNMLITKRINTL